MRPGPPRPEPEGRSRRCRHDGWTPERQAGFLEALAACGIVADASRHVELSAQSAYAFRNRRSGRAFATAWDAVLIHRARGRLGDEVMSRAIQGCVEQIRHDGEVTAERHRFDNRLAMAVLTRLDRLAEKEGERDRQLRAVSEDLEDLLDCIEEGGDADAFVEARRPQPEPDPVEEQRMEESIWAGKDGLLWTCFPPPAGFDGQREGICDGYGFYARTLTDKEMAALDAAELAELAESARLRDRYFGFSGGGFPLEYEASGRATVQAGSESLRTGGKPGSPAPSQPSTSSTYARGGREGAAEDRG